MAAFHVLVTKASVQKIIKSKKMFHSVIFSCLYL